MRYQTKVTVLAAYESEIFEQCKADERLALSLSCICSMSFKISVLSMAHQHHPLLF